MSMGNARGHNRALRNTASELGDAAEKFKSDAGEAIGTMADECRSQAEGMMNTMREFGTRASHAARDGMDHLRSSAGQYLEQGRDRAMGMEKSIEDQIRLRPMQSLLLAAGVGFVAGFFFLRRHD